MKSERGYEAYGPAGPYYPQRAAARGLQGEAVLDCTLTAAGALKGCKKVSETPRKMGFSDAARIMAQRGWIKAEPRVVDGRSVEAERVQVVVPFELTRGR